MSICEFITDYYITKYRSMQSTKHDICTVAALFWKILPRNVCKGDILTLGNLHPSHAGLILNRLTPCDVNLEQVSKLLICAHHMVM